jgi:hypothetical protein
MLKIKGEDSNLDEIEDDIEGAKTGISNEIYFLICQSCLWCASTISVKYNMIPIKNNKILM